MRIDPDLAGCLLRYIVENKIPERALVLPLARGDFKWLNYSMERHPTEQQAAVVREHLRHLIREGFVSGTVHAQPEPGLGTVIVGTIPDPWIERIHSGAYDYLDLSASTRPGSNSKLITPELDIPSTWIRHDKSGVIVFHSEGSFSYKDIENYGSSPRDECFINGPKPGFFTLRWRGDSVPNDVICQMVSATEFLEGELPAPQHRWLRLGAGYFDEVPYVGATGPSEVYGLRTIPEESEKFLISFSFAGDERELVRRIAEMIERKLGHGKVFFDEWYEYYIAGANADLTLQKIYHDRTHLVIPCVSKNYGNKPWTIVEHEAIRALQMKLTMGSDHDRLRILPLRVGDGDIPGIQFNTIIPDIRGRDLRKVVELVLHRLKLIVPSRTSE